LLGTILALLAAHTARALLFCLDPNAPLTIAAAIAALRVVALAATSCLRNVQPACVQPTLGALRYE